jgi:hypothetical protein
VSVSARRLALDGDLRAVSRALGEESAVSPAEAAEAARRLAAAAAVADAAAEARLRRREQTHALKATYRALRHRLRSWRQTASVARLVRFCATRWRGKAAAGAATRARKLRLAARFHRRGVEDKHLRALLFWRDEAAIARGCENARSRVRGVARSREPLGDVPGEGARVLALEGAQGPSRVRGRVERRGV